MDIFPYFTSSCYKGFNDDDEGFYSVYRKVFETLAAEDIEYMEEAEDFEKIPQFGNSSSPFEVVINFYGYWDSYSTKKSYAWLFTHNINEIRDRRVLKLVDKEHKKIQLKARKERNEEVRSLVQFVKKRDKRMAEYRKMLEEKAHNNRIKSQQNHLDQIRKRSELIKEQQQNTKVKSEHEEQLRQLEESYFNQYTDSEGEDESDVEELEEGVENCNLSEGDNSFDDDLYCVACNKFFNTESSKLNHEASKKHKQNVELLKSEMTAEEENYQEKVAQEVQADIGTEDEDIKSDEESELEPVKKTKGKKSKKKNKKSGIVYDSSEPDIEETKEAEEADIISEKVEVAQSDDNEDWSSTKKSAKKSKTKVKSKAEKKTEKSKAPKPEIIEDEDDEEEEELAKPLKVEEPSSSDSSDLRCATCREVFPSKNKLFNHLKKTNHSIYLGEMKAKTGEKVNSKKKK